MVKLDRCAKQLRTGRLCLRRVGHKGHCHGTEPRSSRVSGVYWAEREAREPGAIARRNASGCEKHVVRKYGITVEERSKMLALQNGVCAICFSPEPGGRGTWHIDHDHETLAIRALLCLACNMSIGLLNDDPKLADSVAAYLRRWGR